MNLGDGEDDLTGDGVVRADDARAAGSGFGDDSPDGDLATAFRTDALSSGIAFDAEAVEDEPAGTDDVVGLVHERGARAQVCVIRDGKVVLDEVHRCARDDLFWAFSAGKPFIALLVHRIAIEGLIDLDEPVARYWPEFGKPDITVRHVLSHRAGMPTSRSAVLDMLTMPSWRSSIRAAERAEPRWPAGEVPAYHVINYGFMLGELAQRVTGLPLRALYREKLFAPADLHDTYLGLPRSEWHRHVPLDGAGLPGLISKSFVNNRRVRAAVIPAAGVSTTARDLARFYSSLLTEEPAVAEMRTPTNDDDLIDRFLRMPIRYAQGVQLAGPIPGSNRPLGSLTSALAFGHNGSNVCIAWADPTKNLAFAYCTDRLATDYRAAARHMNAVANATIRRFG